MAKFELLSREGVNYVVAHLESETVRTEAGALRYLQGKIQMESKAPSVGGFLKAALSSESVFKPTYTGTGKLVLEPSLGSFFELELDGTVTYVLDQGAYVASEDSVKVDVKRNSAMAGLAGGEGLFQTWVSSSGTVIVATPGPVEILDLVNDRLVVDGTFAVARDSRLNFRVERSSRSLLGSATSGEGFVNVFDGSGRVYLSPVPNRLLMLKAGGMV